MRLFALLLWHVLDSRADALTRNVQNVRHNVYTRMASHRCELSCVHADFRGSKTLVDRWRSCDAVLDENRHQCALSYDVADSRVVGTVENRSHTRKVYRRCDDTCDLVNCAHEETWRHIEDRRKTCHLYESWRAD